MAIDYIVIGQRIREIRKSKKMTQEKLAEYSELEPSYISHIERAVTKPSLQTLIGIANALEVSLDELVYVNLVKSSHVSVKLVDELIKDCSSDEIAALVEVIKTVKAVLRKKNKTE